VCKHFAQKIVIEPVEKTWLLLLLLLQFLLLLLLLLLLLPKPPRVTSQWCDESQCFQLQMKTNGVRRWIGGPHGCGQTTAPDGRVVFVSSSYADIALGTNGRKSGWWRQRWSRRQ
jgi:hypothetical protein